METMQCAMDNINDVVKLSKFYHVMRNPNNVLGKASHFPEIIKWLNSHMNELDTVIEVLEKWWDCFRALEHPNIKKSNKI